MRGLDVFFLSRRRSASRQTSSLADDKFRPAQTGERHHLHDAVQLAGGELPDDLSRSGRAADAGHDRPTRHRQDETDGKHGVPDDLQLDTALVSDHLRLAVAFA